MIKYLKVMKLEDSIKIPKKVYPNDTGADVRSNENTILEPGEFKGISTGIKLEIPFGYEVQIRPRSGLAFKKGITILNTPASIDESFVGEVKVILINHGKNPFLITKGDRIAQIVLQKRVNWETMEVSEIFETDRGENGFGSSGVK